MSMSKKKWIIALMVIIVMGAVVFSTVKASGEKKLSRAITEENSCFSEEIPYEGENYRYRKNIVTILCLGIDGREKAEKNELIGFGPRADSIYAVVLDKERQKMTLLSISRDTIADVKIFDSLGQEIGAYPMQIGLQYSNGDGLEESCRLQAEAVSKLLNGIPIHGYCALYWNGIARINDAVGQVEVDVPKELIELNPWSFKKTGLTKLTGDQAMEYMRDRDKSNVGGNESRSIRQRTYLEALYQQTKSQIKNPLVLAKVFLEAKDYLVTDLGAGEIMTLASWISDWNINELQICALDGESVTGESHDEFLIDEKAKQELLLELFYERY